MLTSRGQYKNMTRPDRQTAGREGDALTALGRLGNLRRKLTFDFLGLLSRDWLPFIDALQV